MNKLDVTNQTFQQVVDLLQADFTAHFPAKESVAPTTETTEPAAPTAEELLAEKQAALALKTNAASMKVNIKAAFEFLDRRHLSPETVTTLERLDSALLQNITALQLSLPQLFNDAVALYQKVEALSPEPKGWGFGSYKLPTLKTVLSVDAAAEPAQAVKSAQQMYDEAIGSRKELRELRTRIVTDSTDIDKFRSQLDLQLEIFQDAERQPINQKELAATKEFYDNHRKRIKATEVVARELLTKLNVAIAYMDRPPLNAQDLETLKRFNPTFIETLTKAQQANTSNLEYLKRQRVDIKKCIAKMELRMPVLEGEESRLVALINKGAPLTRMASAAAYYVPYDVDKALAGTTSVQQEPAASAT